ncbi:MAG: outer membrane beta-barrel protein [Rhodopseudomonas sp.]|nr:outer membrane beta-barrel protein [Rhodopseudomonas sp.]
MSLLRKLVLIGIGCAFGAPAVLVAASSGAVAADMPRDPPWMPPPTYDRRPQEVEFSSGWYLRGDAGYRLQGIGESSSLDTTSVPTPSGPKLDNAAVFGVGFGIKQSWLRLDVTGDYGWRGKYSADVTGGGTMSGKVESFTVLGNAYADLGTWYGFTPYIGAGIGGTNLTFTSYEYGAAVAPMDTTAVPVQRWNFAWAAMAGVSYNVAHNVLFDLGYRHVDLGDISGGPSSNLSVKKLTGDEVRIGIRYLID